jgi:GR25 family glycosyltransferase involved in LPS biosynthesis
MVNTGSILLYLLSIVILLSVLLLLEYKWLPTTHRNRVTSQFMELKTQLDEEPRVDKIVDKINVEHILYINMDRSHTRREYMEQQFRNMNISHKATRIPAFDGSGKQPFNDIGPINTSLSNSCELGCTLSHLIAVKHAKDHDMDHVLILEDDTGLSLSRWWPHSLARVMNNAPKDWCVINIYNRNMKSFTDTPLYLRDDDKCKFWGCVGYIINKRGIDNVLQKLWNEKTSKFEIDEEASILADVLIYQAAGISNFYTYENSLLYTSNQGELDSTLHTSHTRNHIEISNAIISSYFKKFEVIL